MKHEPLTWLEEGVQEISRYSQGSDEIVSGEELVGRKVLLVLMADVGGHVDCGSGENMVVTRGVHVGQ
jgi:hypothetical protein